MTTTPPNAREINRVRRFLELQQRELDLLILAMPSGNARNVLTDANLHLMSCIDKLNEVTS